MIFFQCFDTVVRVRRRLFGHTTCEMFIPKVPFPNKWRNKRDGKNWLTWVHLASNQWRGSGGGGMTDKISMRPVIVNFYWLYYIVKNVCWWPCNQAEQFHHLWVSPGAVAKENRRRYIQIRRGDSRKGLERIGRYVSTEYTNLCVSLIFGPY